MRLPSLKRWRELRGLTQRELSQRADVSLRAIAGYEAGAEARPPSARKLATSLDVDIGDLVGDGDSPKAEAPPSQLTFNELLEEDRRLRYLHALELFARHMDRTWAARVEGGAIDEKFFEEGAATLFRFEDAYVRAVGTDLLAEVRAGEIDWPEAERKAFDEARAALDAWHRTMWRAYDKLCEALQGPVPDNVSSIEDRLRERSRARRYDELKAPQRAAGE